MQRIAVYVLIGHSLFLFFLLYTPSESPIDIPKKIAIRTVSLAPEKGLLAAKEKTAIAPSDKPVAAPLAKESPKPAFAKESPKLAAKKETSKKTVAKQTPKKTTTIADAPKKVSPKLSPSIDAISAARQALSQLSSNSSQAIASPKGAIGLLSIDGVEGDSYISEMVAKLQKSLKLPEFGQVTVELKLDKSGKVLDLAIKEAKSSLNKMYVEKNLPSLKFKEFEGSLKNEAEHTFIFVLNSLD